MANSKSKILLIVEGEVGETRILGSQSHGLLSLIGAEYEIIPFKNPIYELYDAYKNNEYDDLISYLRVHKNLKIDDNILSKQAFSAIYLIFDFEPHYHKYEDHKIKEMLSIFNDETDLGKLYINYPMVESYYHLSSLPDLDYNNKTISLENFNGKNYKKNVNTQTCLSKNKISKVDLCFIIMHNYNKAKILDGSNSTNINYENILNKQINLKNKNNELYVLNTFSLISIDYNLEYTIQTLKLKLKNNFLEVGENT